MKQPCIYLVHHIFWCLRFPRVPVSCSPIEDRADAIRPIPSGDRGPRVGVYRKEGADTAPTNLVRRKRNSVYSFALKVLRILKGFFQEALKRGAGQSPANAKYYEEPKKGRSRLPFSVLYLPRSDEAERGAESTVTAIHSPWQHIGPDTPRT